MAPQHAETADCLVVTRHGGPEVLEVQTREIPAPGPGQIRVRVAAAGVNFADVYRREGIYPTNPPFVLGDEGSGTVESVGSGVTAVALGELVAWPQSPSSAAGLVIVPADKVVPVLSALDPKIAAAAMLQGLTAQYLVNATYQVQPDDVILVHAAAGGVGQLLTQLAKAKGATVIGTVSTAAKADKARMVGVDHVLNYQENPHFSATVRELTGGSGVAVAYDGVGKSTFDESLASVRIRGMLVLFGAASGQVPPVDLERINAAGSIFVTRPSLAHHLLTRDELLERSNAILAALAAGTLRVEIGGQYPLADAKSAYQDLEGRRTTGKLLLLP